MKNNRAFITILLLAFLIGLLGLTKRGESWDEFLLHRYAERSLNAYQTWAQKGEVKITLVDLGGYGPAFVMLDELIFKFLRGYLPLHPTDIYHLINFATFLAGIWAFYDISARWLTRSGATGATLLLLTQPVVWGHAFMNSKDIPFLAFFLLSLALGFRMMDSAQKISFQTQSDQIKGRLTLLTTLWLVSILGLFLTTNLIHTILADLIHSSANGQPNIVAQLSSNIRPENAGIYIQKYFILFLRIRLIYATAFTFVLLYILARYSPTTLSTILQVLFPAIVLGFTTSIRVLGPLAGVLVVAYGLRTKGRDVIPIAAIYVIISIFAMYLFWPYLWEDPPAHFLESLRLMSSYPWNRDLLFAGQRYGSTELPYSYLPTLLGIQLTEPTWILFFLGCILLIQDARQKTSSSQHWRQALELTLLWFILPVTGLILLRPSLYDNFRQILFILPPVFLIAGVVFSKVRSEIWQKALMIVAILPGIINCAGMYPYEYTYYNLFAGGVRGAQGKYELDYWATSYREAAEYINQIASPNAPIWVEGPAHIFEHYARPDLKVLDAYSDSLAGQDYFIVIQARYGLEKVIAPDDRIIHTVTIDNVPLTVIKVHSKDEK